MAAPEEDTSAGLTTVVRTAFMADRSLASVLRETSSRAGSYWYSSLTSRPVRASRTPVEGSQRTGLTFMVAMGMPRMAPNR